MRGNARFLVAVALRPAFAGVLHGQSKDPVDMYKRAVALERAGKLPEAAKTYEKAVAAAERTLGKSHADTGILLCRLGVVYHGQGEHKRAEKTLLRALDILEKRLGADHLEVATALNN